ncbi:MAG: hypothetical protein HY403_07460 [Elusimicrobia bacterium]|nr:hypothetical protein [Elusimicrobiota bacterium]
MSAPAKCPGCGAKLQRDWEVCPNCPMSFRAPPPEKTALQSDGFRNYGLPLIIFGGLACAVWSLGQYLWRETEEGTKPVPVAAASPSAPQISKPAAPPLPLEKRPVAEEDEGAGVVSIMPAPRARRKPVREWRMRGAVYDLMTLKAVPGVLMVFTDNKTNSRAQTLTDARGRYRVVLPPLAGRGYLVALLKSGYAKSYLDPGTEGVSEMSLERRKELVGELSSLVAEPASLQPYSDAPLETDFHMAPK